MKKGMKKINPKIAKGSCCGIENEPKSCHAGIKNCPVCKYWNKEIKEKEKELKQLWWEREHHRVR